MIAHALLVMLLGAALLPPRWALLGAVAFFGLAVDVVRRG